MAFGRLGWGGYEDDRLHLTNVAGPKTKFLRPRLTSCRCRSGRHRAALVVELGADLGQDVDWIPKIEGTRRHPDRILVASIVAGSSSDKELAHWQDLAKACQDAGADAFELNLSCPHMDRKDMGSNLGKDQQQVSIVTEVVKEVAKVPVWSKLTPSTTEIAEEAGAAFNGGADAIVSSNTFPSLPLIDPETLDFEMNVDGLVSSGGLGGPAILPQSLAKMSQLTKAFPDKEFSGIGGISTFAHALNYMLLGWAQCRSAPRRCSIAIGLTCIKNLIDGMQQSMEKRGYARSRPSRHAPRQRRRPLADLRRPRARNTTADTTLKVCERARRRA